MTAQDKALKENTASAPLQIVAPGTCVETGEQAALVLGMYDHLVETIHQYNPSADFAQIDKAFRYADTHHNGQLRKDGSPFITHPLAVAQIIAEELRLDSESIEAALLHDCIEDTAATYADADAKVAGYSYDCILLDIMLPDGNGLRLLEHIKELLHDGEAIQVVLSSQASAEFRGDAFMLYRRMRSINPSPYMFFMRLPEVTLFGSSPELMVRCTDGKLQLSPIAGTRRRGRDDEEDAALAADLLKDPKECSEHVMLVDLGRNDLGRVAKPGSVKLERLMEIERFSHVMHMTSRVTAQVNDGLGVLDILGAAFPAGTVSGAPKVRAMEILAEEEPLPRGPYAGCIGWLGLDKNGVHMDSGITIRSMWVKDGRIHWQTGAGIVYDSDPAAEWQECMNKGKIIDVILKGEDHVSVH